MSAPAPAAPKPLNDHAFATLMATLGPFERAPAVAVAVSGGPDSMALCLLAQRWVQARGGHLTALIVDHGLRPESATEAAKVGSWLDRHGVRHRRLTWSGAKPTRGIQAAAREARYALLGDGCRSGGVLHLLLGHHRDDQHETRLLRAARGSGPDGLAGMAPVREIEGLRLLRPLLSVPKQNLIATLRAAGQPWFEDPSNRAPRFARARLRQEPNPCPQGDARSDAMARAALDRSTAAWLAAEARIDPAGFVRWPMQAMREAPAAIVRRALQQALAAVGGNPYPPRSVRLDRLFAELRGAQCRGRTLAGCRVMPAGDDLLICREPAAIASPVPLEPARWCCWDRRFALRQGGDAGARLTARALGADGWRQCRHAARVLAGLPAAVRAGLPSVWHGERLVAVARHGHLVPADARFAIRFRFRPPYPLAPAPFAAEPYPWIAANHTFAST